MKQARFCFFILEITALFFFLNLLLKWGRYSTKGAGSDKPCPVILYYYKLSFETKMAETNCVRDQLYNWEFSELAPYMEGFPGSLVVKNPPANAGDKRDVGSVPELGRSPGGAYGNLLQCSYGENPRDGGAWWAAVCGAAQSWTRLKRLSSSSSF